MATLTELGPEAPEVVGVAPELVVELGVALLDPHAADTSSTTPSAPPTNHRDDLGDRRIPRLGCLRIGLDLTPDVPGSFHPRGRVPFIGRYYDARGVIRSPAWCPGVPARASGRPLIRAVQPSATAGSDPSPAGARNAPVGP